MMIIKGILWLQKIVAKIRAKHQVSPEEVEQVFTDRPKFRFIQKGLRRGENVYLVSGQTEAGRYLAVIFIHKRTGDALILSARKMAARERKEYDKK